MKVLFSSVNLVEMHHLKNLLQSAGIRCHLRNEHLFRLAGEIPFPECALQLVLDRPEDGEQAERIVREFARPPTSPGPAWHCPACGEALEGQFTSCWNCGRAR